MPEPSGAQNPAEAIGNAGAGGAMDFAAAEAGTLAPVPGAGHRPGRGSRRRTGPQPVVRRLARPAAQPGLRRLRAGHPLPGLHRHLAAGHRQRQPAGLRHQQVPGRPRPPATPSASTRKGCDVYTRTVYGARASITVGVCATTGAAVLGSVLGASRRVLRRLVGLAAVPGQRRLLRHPDHPGRPGLPVRRRQQHRLAGHRLHRAAGLAADRPYRPGFCHHRQAERLRPGGPRAGGRRAADAAAAHHAERGGAGDRGGHHRAGHVHLAGGHAVLPRGRAAARRRSPGGSTSPRRPPRSATPRTCCCGRPAR